MNILSGLERYFFNQKIEEQPLYSEEPEELSGIALKRKEGGAASSDGDPAESTFLLEKTMTCPVCQNVFKTPVLKSSRARRLQPDQDLRPRFAYIDTNKYDVACCPKCGYAALNRNFPMLSSLQVKLIKEGIQSKFDPSAVKFADDKIFSYETAIDRYKLALYNAVVKHGRDSEKAFTCLKLSWLYRGLLEEWDADKEKKVDENIKKEREKEERLYYEQAYEGFIKAIGTENPPICGMDDSTLDLLLGSIAFRLQKYDQASRFISNVMSSKTASRNAKDRALDLKDQIVQEIHNSKG